MLVALVGEEDVSEPPAAEATEEGAPNADSALAPEAGMEDVGTSIQQEELGVPAIAS